MACRLDLSLGSTPPRGDESWEMQLEGRFEIYLHDVYVRVSLAGGMGKGAQDSGEGWARHGADGPGKERRTQDTARIRILELCQGGARTLPSTSSIPLRPKFFSELMFAGGLLAMVHACS